MAHEGLHESPDVLGDEQCEVVERFTWRAQPRRNSRQSMTHTQYRRDLASARLAPIGTYVSIPSTSRRPYIERFVTATASPPRGGLVRGTVRASRTVRPGLRASAWSLGDKVPANNAPSPRTAGASTAQVVGSQVVGSFPRAASRKRPLSWWRYWSIGVAFRDGRAAHLVSDLFDAA